MLEARRSEDAAAARALGCTVCWLGLPDAIYRDRYTSDQELFGPLPAEERELASHLAEEIRHLPEWREGNRAFVPLGVGSHVDHQLVFETGRRLAAQGVEVYAYEDCPYAIHTPEGQRTRLAAVEGKVGELVLAPIEETLEQRPEAIACFSSTGNLPLHPGFPQCRNGLCSRSERGAWAGRALLANRARGPFIVLLHVGLKNRFWARVAAERWLRIRCPPSATFDGSPGFVACCAS